MVPSRSLNHKEAPFKTSITLGRRCHDPTYDGDDPHPAQLVRSAGYEARLAVWEAGRQVAVVADELDYG
jgi:hypothetical protein